MGGKQFGFGDYEQSAAKKRIRRERFLAEPSHSPLPGASIPAIQSEPAWPARKRQPPFSPGFLSAGE